MSFGDAIRHLFENEQLVKSTLMVFLIDIPCLYLFGRYCLLFPAIAIDFRPIPDWTWPKNVNWAWSQSKENEWQLVLLAGGLPSLVGWVNMWMFSMFGQESVLLVYFVFSSFLMFAFILIEVAVISIAFRELTNWTPSSQLSHST